MTEAQIQTKIINTLRGAGWFVTKLIVTSTPGIMDVLALKDGRALFIEVKRPGMKPTDLQQHRAKQIIDQGFEVITATSVSDVTQFLVNTS